MSSSDEEGEIFPECVTDYAFVNRAEEHVSLACLPLLLRKDEVVDNGTTQVFLSCVCDEGLRKIYKEVLGWRYEISYARPEISVLCKGSGWTKLLMPKRLYEAVLRSVLVTVHCLHFVKHNPEAAEEYMWSQLSKVFSSYEVAPFENDCINHISLIRDAADSDPILKDSKFIQRILSGEPMETDMLKLESVPAERPEFIVDEEIYDDSEDDETSDEEEVLFDTCCSFCDNGGDILCCEGRCMRSFHASRQTGDSGEEICEGLGFSEDRVKALSQFICRNCRYQRHQCFICGKLGISDLNGNVEVFPCIVGNCGRFYHPKCVVKELQQQNDAQIENLEEKIVALESFVCPAHRCFSCNQLEDRTVPEMQFAVCRRCPKSYHRKCLPREIMFDTEAVVGILPRAWDGLLPKRILIYCLNHEIDPHLGTPLRNHILFPPLKVKLRNTEKPLSGLPVELKKRKLDHSNPLPETVVRNTQKQAASEPGRLIDKHRHDFICEKKPSAIKPSNANKYSQKLVASHSAMPLTKKQGHSSPVVDIEIERRINTLIEKVNSSFNAGDFIKQKNATSKSSNNMIDKNLTKGKVEGAVKAVQNALQKLENGASIDIAKAVCDVDMLRQLPIWKNKLKIYLAPFMHGMHYSSFGRHFTKTEKLREIVDRLHNYVKDGDMIVDFCCGANEFSCLMKEKLDAEGKKKCSFKNYDLFPTRNDFNFEQKNWYDVDPRDLPRGSQLVMGLNPPFGYKASLANKFINKALQFKPKLLILIVPPETQRLDRRNNKHLRYDLLWEDHNLLAGESFYLPGAFGAVDKQISQWNNTTPPLYLWSHPDWTRKHKEIANRCGHSFSRDKLPERRPPSPKHFPEEQQDAHGDFNTNTYLVDDIPEPMNAGNMVTGNIYGQDKSNVYDYNMSNAYGHHMSNVYSPPRSNVFGPSTSNVYSPIYSPMSNVYGPSTSNVYAHPMSNVYSHSSHALDDYHNTPSVEDKYIDIPCVPELTDVGGQMGRNLSGRENVTYLRSDSPPEDMEISPTNTNLRRNIS
ncbi:protein ENHANCED DOWNY MILDEW 2-like [Silene latifolia]|uniref:protein ENHANCED DOWNY MILDEW 2-like n=1 Tax=Silene latifolia TaxID=37657 RepID=UPI003D78A865